MSVKLKINDIFHMSYGTTIFSAEEMTDELNKQVNDFNKAILVCDDNNKGLSDLEIISCGPVLLHRNVNSPRYFVYETKQFIDLTSDEIKNQNWYLIFN